MGRGATRRRRGGRGEATVWATWVCWGRADLGFVVQFVEHQTVGRYEREADVLAFECFLYVLEFLWCGPAVVSVGSHMRR